MKMKNALQEIPQMERPRERLLYYGAAALADYELLAILLRVGTVSCSVLDLARSLTTAFPNLTEMSETTVEELTAFQGIGKVKAIELIAVAELGRRMNQISKIGTRISDPYESYEYLYPKLQSLHQETLVCIFLNTKNEVIHDRIITIGTIDHTIFHPRDILKWSLKFSAFGIIVAHNHPSGDPNPSEMDYKMTESLKKACEIVGLNFVDHIIIGKGKFYSFVQKQIVKKR